MNDNWQPIADAPRNRPILVTIAGPDDYYPERVEWSETHERWVKHILDNGKAIGFPADFTHWMPLPDSPRLTTPDE